MKVYFKTILSTVLAYIIVLMTLQVPMTAFAREMSFPGNGTEQSPYVISTAEEYQAVMDAYGQDENIYIEFDNDITIADYIPIKNFKANLNGNYHILSSNRYFADNNYGVIKNLNFTSDLFQSYDGICSVNNGVISNVVINLSIDSNVEYTSYADGVCETNNGLISNVAFVGKINAYSRYFSGYATGISYKNTGSIVNCYVVADITARGGDYGKPYTYGLTSSTKYPINCYYNCSDMTSQDFVDLLNSSENIDPTWLVDTDNSNNGYPILNKSNSDIIIYNSCGENAYFEYNVSTSTLYVKGTGDMMEYSYSNNLFSNATIKSVVICDGITRIGSYAFYNLSGLENVSISDTVTSIGNSAFENCSKIKDLYIPSSVTSISGNYTFKSIFNIAYTGEAEGSPWGASNVNAYFDDDFAYADSTRTELVKYFGNAKNVIIINSVKTIKSYAFAGCEMESVELPNKLESIGDYAFNRCPNLASITVPNSVNSIGKNTFDTCESLNKVVLGTGIDTISDYMFNNCTELTDITIPDNIVNIGNYAFYNCRALESLYLPASVTSIGNSAFRLCIELTNITIPNSVTNLGASAFNYCKNLSAINIPDGIKYLDGTFNNCQKLTKIIIPNSVTNIYNYTFENCKGLKELTIPCSAKIYGSSSVFLGCDNIEKIIISKGNGVMQNFSDVYSDPLCYYTNTPWYKSKNNLKELVLEDGITYIGTNAFYDLTSIDSIQIPDSVTSIGTNAFYNANNIVYNGTATGSPWGAKRFNAVYDEDWVYKDSSKTEIIEYKGSNTEVIIPNTVTKISEKLFYNNTNITSVVIPNSVTSIGNYAFYGCTALKSINIPDSVIDLGNYVFRNCDNLSDVIIGNGVTSIGASVFRDCKSLTTITVGKSVSSIGSYAFYGCNSLLRIILPDGVTNIENYAFYNCSGLKEISLPCSVRISSDGYAFSGCTGIEKMNISKGNGIMQSFSGIYYYMPWYLSRNSLKELTIEDGVKNISDYSFRNCISLTRISIPNSVTEIGTYAFYGCTGADSIVVPNGVTSIGNNAFTSVKNIIYSGPATGSPWGAKYINAVFDGDWIYQNTEKTELIGYLGDKTDVIIPDNVTVIGERAFYNKSNITSIVIPDSVTNISNYAFYGCSSLLELTMPCSAMIYNSFYTFNNCNHIQRVTITKGNGVMPNYLGSTSYTNTPWYCSRSTLQGLIIEDGVTNIGDNAFYGLSNLVSVVLPISVMSIGNNSFNQCSSLSRLYILNKECNIYQSSTTIPTNATIYGYDNSTASAYANKYARPFAEFYGICPDCGSYYLTAVKVPPTCTEQGYSNLTCDECNNEFVSLYVEATGHTVVVDNAVSPNCTQSGLTEGSHCSVCNKIILKQNVIPEEGHSYSHYITYPNCEDDGFTTNICDKCKDIYISDVVDKLGHNYVTTVVNPTCTTDGYTIYTCTRCNDSYKDNYLDALGHTEVADNAISATCNTTGLTEGKHCSVCKLVLVAQKEVKALGHNWDNGVITVEPNCIKTGTIVYTCQNDKGHSYSDVVPALNHSYTSVVTEPTCVDAGFTTFTCIRCKNSYKDSFTSALEHDCFPTVTPPTHLENGFTTYNCSRCDYSYTSDLVLAEGHIKSDAVVENLNEATCDGAGLYDSVIYCSVCKAELVRTTITLDKYEHDYQVTKEYKSPTCLENGNEEEQTCSLCGKIIGGQTLDALNHSFDKTSIPATCTSKGYTKYECIRCDYEYIDNEIEKLDHSLIEIVSAVAPTCMENGRTAGYECENCDYEIISKPIDSLGHDYQVKKNRQDATCTQAGTTELMVCKSCFDVVGGDIIEPLGHTNSKPVIENIVDSTCEQNGSYDEVVYCVICNLEISRINKSVAKLGHDYEVTNKAVEALCIKTGLTEQMSCTRCGKIIGGEIIEAKGHNYNKITTAPTCTEQGYTTYICERCDNAYLADYVDPLKHCFTKYLSNEDGYDSNCTETGITDSQTAKCDRCGETDTIVGVVIPAKGHTEVIDKSVTPTCTEIGLTEGKHCSVCNTVLVKQEVVDAFGHTQKTTVTNATTSKNGKITYICSVCKATLKSATTIYYPKTITLSATSYTYDGKVKKPTVKVVDANGKTIATSNYTVTYSSGLKDVGKYTVKITFKGNYSGTVSKTFVINPKNTSISKLTATKGGFKATIKKYTTQTTGYQIRYSTKSNMSGAKTVTIAKNTTTSKSVTGLSKGKKYYVQIRTFKTVNGTKYYSAWSDSKTVTTKK